MEFRLEDAELRSQFEDLVVAVPDFPKPGILFRDITPALAHPKAFGAMIELLSRQVPRETTKLVGIESRGFILGSAVAQRLNLGIVLARKPGKLPRAVLTEEYSLEYGTDRLEIHADALGAKDQVSIIDDVLATGGTAAAVERLVTKAGAKVLRSVFLLEIQGLHGGSRLSAPYQSLLIT